MPESAWLILFKKEVADPGKTIGACQCCQDPPRIASQEQGSEAEQSYSRTSEMQFTTTAVGVFAEIDRVEIREGRVFSFRDVGH